MYPAPHGMRARTYALEGHNATVTPVAHLLWFTLFSSHSGLFLLWVCLLGHDSQKGALVYPSADEPGPFRWVNAEEQSRLYP